MISRFFELSNRIQQPRSHWASVPPQPTPSSHHRRIKKKRRCERCHTQHHTHQLSSPSPPPPHATEHHTTPRTTTTHNKRDTEKQDTDRQTRTDTETRRTDRRKKNKLILQSKREMFRLQGTDRLKLTQSSGKTHNRVFQGNSGGKRKMQTCKCESCALSQIFTRVIEVLLSRLPPILSVMPFRASQLLARHCHRDGALAHLAHASS